MKAVFSILIVVASAFAEVRTDSKIPTDEERLQGTWKMVSIESNGELEKNDVGKTLTFHKDKLLLHGLDTACTLKLNPDKNPKEFDLIYEGTVFGTVVVKGIYKLDGNTLTACYPNSEHNQERPKAFSGAKGRKQALLKAKRAQGKER